MPPNLSTQLVCQRPKVLDFNEKRLHWASVVRDSIIPLLIETFCKRKKTVQYGLDAKVKGGKSDKLRTMYVLVQKILDEIQNPISCLLAVQIFCKKNLWGKIGCMYSQKYEVA